eukprot:3052678-Amphidinium_carterae.1
MKGVGLLQLSFLSTTSEVQCALQVSNGALQTPMVPVEEKGPFIVLKQSSPWHASHECPPIKKHFRHTLYIAKLQPLAVGAGQLDAEPRRPSLEWVSSFATLARMLSQCSRRHGARCSWLPACHPELLFGMTAQT